MLGSLLPSTDMARATSISLQARTWWFSTKQGVTIAPDSYTAYLASHPGTPYPEPAILALIEDVQRRMGVTGPVPSWQAHAPKADLGVKAADGAAKGEGAGGGDDAPYPEHFKAVIEAVTLGKPVPGIKEIPNTVVRLPVSTSLLLFPLLPRLECLVGDVRTEKAGLKRAYHRLARCKRRVNLGRWLPMDRRVEVQVTRQMSRPLCRKTVSMQSFRQWKKRSRTRIRHKAVRLSNHDRTCDVYAYISSERWKLQ